MINAANIPAHCGHCPQSEYIILGDDDEDYYFECNHKKLVKPEAIERSLGEKPYWCPIITKP